MRIVCVGGANIDRKYALPGHALPQTSNPASASATFGGVARNIAENLARLGADVALLAVIGDDADGAALKNHAAAAGVDVGWVHSVPNRRTTEYAAVIDGGGDLVIGVNDMALLYDALADEIERHRDEVVRSDWLFVDCNLSQATLAAWMRRARATTMRLAIDAVSEPKVRNLPADLHGVDVLFLNDGEARAYLGESGGETPEARADALQKRGAGAIVLTLGADGLVVADASRTLRVAAVGATAIDVTGAGDALVAATLFRLMAGDVVADAARFGARAAALTVESKASVLADLAERLQIARKNE